MRSHPGSSPAPPRSAGRRVRPRVPPRAAPRHRGRAGGAAWGTSLPRCSGPCFHAGQRVGTLPASGAGSAGLLPVEGSGISSRSESVPVSSSRGSPSSPLSPSALMTSCAASRAGDQGRVLRWAASFAIDVSLCLRAGGGVRISRGWCTCCGRGGAWVQELVRWFCWPAFVCACGH